MNKRYYYLELGKAKFNEKENSLEYRNEIVWEKTYPKSKNFATFLTAFLVWFLIPAVLIPLGFYGITSTWQSDSVACCLTFGFMWLAFFGLTMFFLIIQETETTEICERLLYDEKGNRRDNYNFLTEQDLTEINSAIEKNRLYNEDVKATCEKWRQEHPLEEKCRLAMKKNPNYVADLIRYVKEQDGRL